MQYQYPKYFCDAAPALDVHDVFLEVDLFSRSIVRAFNVRSRTVKVRGRWQVKVYHRDGQLRVFFSGYARWGCGTWIWEGDIHVSALRLLAEFAARAGTPRPAEMVLQIINILLQMVEEKIKNGEDVITLVDEIDEAVKSLPATLYESRAYRITTFEVHKRLRVLKKLLSLLQ